MSMYMLCSLDPNVLENADPKFLYALVPALSVIVVQFLKGIKPLKGLIESKESKVLVSIGLSIGLAYLTGLANPVLVGILLGLAGSGGYDLRGLLVNPPSK